MKKSAGGPAKTHRIADCGQGREHIAPFFPGNGTWSISWIESGMIFARLMIFVRYFLDAMLSSRPRQKKIGYKFLDKNIGIAVRLLEECYDSKSLTGL
jgi:hypothetical protein